MLVLLLTALGNGGRGQVLLTIDQRASPVDHRQRPACVRRDGRLRVTQRVGVARVRRRQLRFVLYLYIIARRDTRLKDG